MVPHARAGAVALRRVVVGAFRVIVDEGRRHLRLDLPLIIMVLVFLGAFAPIVSRVTENPHILRCCVSDEAPLSMALDGMRVVPYGDPFNFVLGHVTGKELPEYWGKINYAGVGYYYGGVYMGLAFLAYAPLQALGLPPFPTAPIILRSLSLLAGLLAVMMIYNFGRLHIGRIGGSIAVLILFTDHYFSYYSTIVHPDSTQFALSILALAVAVRHVRTGDIESLAALGLLSGLVQGTKMGGPWMIPMVATATIAGLVLLRGGLHQPGVFRELVRRGLLLVGISLATYFVTTPYAFVSKDFYNMTMVVLRLVGSSWITPTNAFSWFSALWANLTPPIMMAALVGTILVCIHAVRGQIRWPMLLLFVLGASQFLWYGINSKYWVELGYMLGTFAAVALFAGECVEGVGRLLGRVGTVGRVAARFICGFVVVALLVGRWWAPSALALTHRLTDALTSIQLARWAEADNIPRNARVIWDDSAYLDPNKFPNAYFRGDLLTYNQMYAYRPDYVILASSMFGAAHFSSIRKTQRFTMQNEGPFSVRLYQDFLDNETSKPVAAPGTQYVRSFSEGVRDCTGKEETGRYEPWFGEDAPGKMSNAVVSLFGANPVGLWLAPRAAVQTAYANYAGRLIDAIRGKICISIGPTFHVFRIIPPGTAQGFSQPVASSSWDHLSPLNAFDGEATHWMPSRTDPNPEPWVGFDFGDGVARAPRQLRIEWFKSDLIAPEIEVQYSDWEQGWHSAGIFQIDVATVKTSLASQHPLPPSTGAHRLWRVVFRNVNAPMVAVREVRFLDQVQ
ncbi:glycosyltransferase family 39 protein [Bradyrhizobium sp. AUGA SZCCT0274]|uniref:glycosyltransferase family 39 protein n=1 Tax=Bradyrhizobium sp. AUGA SZCCT0274 TaxID=2807670 RepID=UPI001BAD2E51|nr:glycosyltransferase family 39 protein [Bradyrhizobium sp. AUGA SZCCT0274]MBR1245281.1 glycosyltransferase family 39 protein [Bradyrhizobium sp. AUGA SZCCT0274]